MLRRDENHNYFWNDTPVPGVTDILEAANITDYSRIPDDGRRERGMRRGSAVHLAVQFDNESDLDMDSVRPDILPFVQANQSFTKHTGFVPLETEVMGYNSTYKYAGELDVIGQVPDGRIWLVDYKCGDMPRSAEIQTASYAELDEIKAKYPVLERYAVRLQKNAMYKMFGPFLDPNDFQVFLSCLNIHRWKMAA